MGFKDSENKNMRFVSWGIRAFFMIIVAALIVLLLTMQEKLIPDRLPVDLECLEFEDEWQLELPAVTADGSEANGTVVVPNVVPAELGEHFSISHVLPEREDFDTIMIWDRGQYVNAYLDGELFYTYDVTGADSVGIDRPYAYIFAKLPEEHAGKRLTLEFYSVVPTDNGRIGSISVGTDTSLLISAIKDFQLEVIAAIVLLCLSVEMMTQSIYIRLRVGRRDSLFSLGAGIFTASCWVLADSRIRQFIFVNYSVIRDMAFYCVAILPAALSFYMNHIQENRYEHIYLFFAAVSIINTAVQVIINFSKIAGLSQTISFSQLWCMLLAIALSINIFRDFRKKLLYRYRMAAAGLLILGIAGGIQILYYRYAARAVTSGKFMIIGLVVMTMCCILQNYRELGVLHRDKEHAEQAAHLLSVEAMESLAKTVDAKDLYTSGHSQRVAAYSREIARRLGLDAERQEHIFYIALLHDVGKIGVPDEIINKPGRLTDEEFEKIKAHPVIGADIMEKFTVIPHLYEGVRYHHERYDGHGYPDGLAGDRIPLIARIIAVADSYDAMTSERSYRNSMPQEAVRGEIERCRGTQFDPEIADIMLQMIDEDTLYLLREKPENSMAEHSAAEAEISGSEMASGATEPADKNTIAAAAAKADSAAKKVAALQAEGTVPADAAVRTGVPEIREADALGAAETNETDENDAEKNDTSAFSSYTMHSIFDRDPHQDKNAVPGVIETPAVRFINKLKKLLKYAGLSQEEFESIRSNEMAESNRSTLRVFSLAGAVCMAGTLINSTIVDPSIIKTQFYLIGIAVSIVIYFAAKSAEKNKAIVYPLMYVSIALFFLFGLVLGVNIHQNINSVTYIVLMIFIPMLFVERPSRILAVIIGAYAVFIYFVMTRKTGVAAECDFVNATSFGILSLISNAYMMVVKIRRFETERIVERHSRMDQLTGVYNRNYYERKLDSYKERTEKTLFCVYVDVNGLHDLNNSKGHAAGDRMLQSVAAELKAVFGEHDTYRIGGDEFVAFGIDQDNTDIVYRLHRFQENITAYGYHVSLGYDIGNAPDIDMKKLIESAEKHMYEAKSAYYAEHDRRRDRAR